MVDVVKYIYAPGSELPDQSKISTIKNCVPGKTHQMPYKIYKDKRKKGGESKRHYSYDCFHTFKSIDCSKLEAGLFYLACVLFTILDYQVAGLRF